MEQIFSSREIDNKLLFDENVIVVLSQCRSFRNKVFIDGYSGYEIE